MDYKDILINILCLSYFHNKNTSTQYLLLEPIVIRKIFLENSISKEDFKKYMLHFINDETIVEQIFNYYISNKLIINKNNCCVINNLYDKEKINQYNAIYTENSNYINSIETFLIKEIDKDIIKNKNILEYFYSFLINILIIDNDLKTSISDIDRIISFTINEVITNENNNYRNIIRNIIKGIVILKAVKNSTKSNILESNKIRIYVDNIFITNLFAWCEEVYHNSTILTLQALQLLDFDVSVHDITVELITRYVESAKKQNINKIRRNSLAYNIIFGDYNNKKFVDVRKSPPYLINNIIIENITNNGIKIVKGFKYEDKEKNIELYNKIHDTRKKINLLKKKRNSLEEKQTLYDYTIILLYDSIDYSVINKLTNMKNIFLTFQNAIINNVIYKTTDLYKPIMNTNIFVNLLLIESIVSNIQKYSNLVDIIVTNSYAQILGDSINTFIENVYKDSDINKEQKEHLFDLTKLKPIQKIIIESNMEPKIVENKIINEIEKKEKEKEEALDEKERKDKKDKFIHKVLIVALLSTLLFIISDNYLAPYIIKISNKLKKDFIDANYISSFIGLLPSIIVLINWFIKKNKKK